MVKDLRRKDKDPEYALNTAGIILAGLARYKHETVTTDPAVDKAIHAAMNPPGGNHICEAEKQLGTVIYNDFNGSGVIERLQAYEQRIENSLFKTIRQIQQIQENRIKQDAACDRRDWQQIREESEERKRQKEADHQQRIQDACGPDPHCHSEQNKANSPLTLITEMTYNRSRYAKAKRNESNQTNLTNPEQPPRPNNQ